MKKQHLNSLPLKKVQISKLNSAQVTGGEKTTKCFYSIKIQCNTRMNCNSSPLVDCTVTYQACVTEPRFCGMIG